VSVEGDGDGLDAQTPIVGLTTTKKDGEESWLF